MPSPTQRNFNPSNSLVVDGIKEGTDNMIQYLTDNVPASKDREEAIKNYRQAAMWAVRSVFP